MRLFRLSTALLTLVNGVQSDSGGALYPPGLVPLITHANSLLSAEQFNDAAKVYAIEQSPSDYLLYYKRATAYFSLSRHPNAISDFDKVIDLTSNAFDKAHLMKARIYAKDGLWLEARDALKQHQQRRDRHEKAVQAHRAKLWTACEEASSAARSIASHSIEIRQQRAECSLAAGDLEMTVGDLTRLIRLTAPSTAAFMRIFQLSYFLLPTTSSQSALPQLKQCLHYDPDSKECFSARRVAKLKQLSTLEREGVATKFNQALEESTSQETLGLPLWLKLIPPKQTSPRKESILRGLCKAYVGLGQPTKGEKLCLELEKMQGGAEDVDALVGKGEALLVHGYEEAVRVMEKAWEACGRSDKYVQQRVMRAQKLLNQSRQKDYYKVLDVSRDTDQKTIKKPYRKATMKAHPDKGGTEAKMAAVNEAYEVLSDPELRSRFDNGDDPNDPMAQQSGHPFPAGGFNAVPFAQFFQGGSRRYQYHFSHGGRH